MSGRGFHGQGFRRPRLGGQRAGRAAASAAVALSLLVMPLGAQFVLPSTAAHAEEASAPLTAALDEDAISTSVTVSTPVQGTQTIYLLGQEAPLSATVRALPAAEHEEVAAPEGTVEFFDGDVSLGEAPVEVGSSADRATASIETDRWPASGARQVTAEFTPAEGSPYAPSSSAAQTYRIVDTTRIVPDIALEGAAAAEVADASLEWTIGNIWFSNFEVGFEREVLGGNVTLPDMRPGSTIAELQEYYWRPFTFSEGTGEVDAAGNRIISFSGAARLTSGSGNQWNFTDPVVHISPTGEGYITAEFSGFYRIGVEQTYGPTRVTIATFSQSDLAADAEGFVEAEIELNWEGQANGPGTWAQQHSGSFPNEFVALLNPGVNLFFAESSVATDSSKVPHPITLSYREVALGGGETPGENPEEPGESPEEPGEEPGDSDGGTGDPDANPGDTTEPEDTDGSTDPADVTDPLDPTTDEGPSGSGTTPDHTEQASGAGTPGPVADASSTLAATGSEIPVWVVGLMLVSGTLLVTGIFRQRRRSLDIDAG